MKKATAKKKSSGKKSAKKKPEENEPAGKSSKAKRQGRSAAVKAKSRAPARRGRESREDLRKRAKRIAAVLRKKYPGAGTALKAENPFQLLVSTVLSAQCTDKRVNMVTETLFKKYRSPGDFARARRSTLEKEIRPTGFFRAKAKSIMELSQDIVDRFDGGVPDNIDDLVTLRGVGRKTANVVLAGSFNKPAIAVDTHVKRVSGRLGLTRHTDPVKIEFDLMEILPRREWQPFSFIVILHGREVCKSRKPRCEDCVLEKYCPSSTLAKR
ncbi:MAG: endonuclease III [bacterium]|jgi:endonuclease-3